MDLLTDLTSIIVLSGIIPIVLFITYYVQHSPFEQYPEGVTILLQKIAILALFGIIILGYFAPDYPARPWLRLVIYVAVVYLFWADFVNLRRVQRQYPWTRTWRRSKMLAE